MGVALDRAGYSAEVMRGLVEILPEWLAAGRAILADRRSPRRIAVWERLATIYAEAVAAHLSDPQESLPFGVDPVAARADAALGAGVSN